MTARGFWVVGLSGRRAVLEGFAYTDEAYAAHGVDGRIFSQQLSPFVERSALNDAVFENGDVAAVEELRDRFGARWIVVVERSGSSPTFPLPAAMGWR